MTATAVTHAQPVFKRINAIFAITSDGPQGGMSLDGDKLHQQGRGLDCKSGVDGKPGGGGEGGGRRALDRRRHPHS